MTNFKEKLTSLVNQDNSIRDFVIDEVLSSNDNDEGIKAWFQDLQKGGCQSGMISSLIYYTQTEKFFNDYYDEIEELRQDWTENQGYELKIKGDLRNFLAWFAFEEVAYHLADELGLNN